MTQQLKDVDNDDLMDRTTSVELGEPKPLWMIYAGMLFSREEEWTPGERVPSVHYRQRKVRADLANVTAYHQLCGEGRPDILPPIYPHIMATPLQMNLLESDDFPLRLAGLVHLGQDIEWHLPIPQDATLDLSCSMQGPEETERGWEFCLQTDALLNGKLAWREYLTFLKPDPKKRGRQRIKRRGEGDAMHFVPLLHMQFPENAGRRYARVSGDWNPIHLWPFLSKRFGFRKPIAHGMFTLARCLSVLQARGIELTGKRMTATFRAPVMLPAFTNFCLNDRHPENRFALTDARKGRILVEGELQPLQETVRST